MKFRFVFYILLALVFAGCSAGAKKSDVSTQPPEIRNQPTVYTPSNEKPVMLHSNGVDFFVWKYNGRMYVIGNPETNADFTKLHHLPYTRTLLGAGPVDETVIFEVVKKNPAFTDRLVEKFEQTPFLLHTDGDSFNVWKYNGRIYVIGTKKVNEGFKTLHHLPYTRTILGAGPNGETVIYEVDKKNPELSEQLKTRYENTPVLLESEENYYVWKYKGRIYVIGNESTHESFGKSPHLPYTRTILGAGPNGETVIFEVDKKKENLSEQLKQRYEEGII